MRSMGITFEFPSPLKCGDSITVIGQVGKSRFSLKLESDFESFNPDSLLSSTSNWTTESSLVGRTVPLLVHLDTCGEWEVIGTNPETSSNASGFSACRNGFRSGDAFVCKICIKKDNFEVFLNDTFLSLSEHMIPVSCIQRVIIDGDCRIGRLLFGDKIAVERSSHRSRSLSTPRARCSITQQNLEEAKVVECRIKEPNSDSLFSNKDPLYSPYSSPRSLRKSKNERQIQPDVEGIPDTSPSNMRRVGSLYQFVFDISDDEGEKNAVTEAPHRANSCVNIAVQSSNMVKRPPFLALPTPVIRRLDDISQASEVRQGMNQNQQSRPNPYHSPSEVNQRFTQPRTPEIGFAIKMNHPAVQVDGAPQSPNFPFNPLPKMLQSLSCNQENRLPIAKYRTPMYMKNDTRKAVRHPSIPFAIR